MPFWGSNGGGSTVPPVRVIYEAGGNPLYDAATGAVTTEQDVIGAGAGAYRAAVTIPAAYVGAHSRVVVEMLVDSINSANVKTVRPKIGGDSFGAIPVTSSAGNQVIKRLHSRGAVNLWTTLPASQNDFATNTGTLVDKTYDWTTDKDFTLTFQTATAGEKMQLKHIRIYVENPAS